MELASWIYPGIRPYVYEGGCDGSGLVIKTCFFKTKTSKRVHRLGNLDLTRNLARCKQSLLHSNIEIIIIMYQFYVTYYVILRILSTAVR